MNSSNNREKIILKIKKSQSETTTTIVRACFCLFVVFLASD